MRKIATELQTSYEVEKNLMILNGYNAGTIEWEQLKASKLLILLYLNLTQLFHSSLTLLGFACNVA